jgi:hypothetical protein
MHEADHVGVIGQYLEILERPEQLADPEFRKMLGWTLCVRLIRADTSISRTTG